MHDETTCPFCAAGYPTTPKNYWKVEILPPEPELGTSFFPETATFEAYVKSTRDFNMYYMNGYEDSVYERMVQPDFSAKFDEVMAIVASKRELK